MKIHLYWLDKNWQSRGYANNYNLIVDMEDKTYKTYTSVYCGYSSLESVEVKRRCDIIGYMEYLKANGFTEVTI